MENYKLVENFPAYRISDLGNIQTRWQQKASYMGFFTEDVWKNLPAHADSKGYLQVHLCNGKGIVKTERIHNIVMRAFVGEKPKGLVVRHLDSNPSNNRLDNLKYGTYTENENDKIENGTWNTRNGGAKITPEQVKKIRERANNGEPQKKLAEEYGVSRPTITRIVNNTTWRK